MKISKIHLVVAFIGVLTLSLQACKTKKLVTKTNPPKEAPAAKPVEEKQPEKVVEERPAAAVEKPDFNFSNVQFEFNSGVLKTASFTVLDRVAQEMKKDPAVKFILNGHSSAEGTPEHNMSLSVDRANSVKSYLVNAGVEANNLTIKGYGATQPINSNDTEEARAVNRRVEFKINP